jgi:hypothetical protein
VTDGDKEPRLWYHVALLEAPDGRLSPAFVIDERTYPNPETARAAVDEAFATLQREGIAAEFETVLLQHPGEHGWPAPSWLEYRTRFDPWRPAPRRDGRILTVALGGMLDRERVNGLQDALGMRRCGRLDDDSFDRSFGDRILSRDGDSWTQMRLHRHAERKWSASVSTHNAELPSAEQVALWRDQIVAAATAAGLSVGEIRVRPDLADAQGG